MSESSTGATAKERRRHERLLAARRVAIRCTEGVMSVFGWGRTFTVPALLDLSSGGARLAMHEAPEIGSILRLDIKTDEGKSFEALGEVRWSRPDASGTVGFHCGVEFFKSTARLRQDINDLCRWVVPGLEEVQKSAPRSVPA